MDYTKLPSQLVCRTRNSLEEFTINNEMNECLVDNMLDIYFLQSSNFKERATACFNTAYYICTLILVDEHPEWSLPKYYDIAYCNQKNNFEGQAIVLSLVRVYLLHFDSDWHEKHKKVVEKLEVFLSSHWIQQGNPFLNDYSYQDAFNNLNSFSVATAPFSTTEFALRVIDQETIEEIQIANFSWARFTDYYKYNIMQDIVFHVGKTEDEMTLLVNSLRHDAAEFYSKNNPYYESVCSRLNEIEQDIYFYYHGAENEAIMQAEIEELQYLGDVRPLQARIAELEKEVRNLKVKLPEFEYADDEQGEPQENKQPKAEKLNSESINQTQEITDALKRIEEQEETIKDLNETINEQQSDLEHQRTLNEALTKQIARYEEENPEMDIDEDTALGIKESIIFFSSIMDCNLSKEDISQMNFARLIAKITQWNKESIRTQIVDINTERENNAKNHTAFSDGVHQAAVNVCALIENAMAGLKKNPLPYSCKQAVENICKIYKSPGRKIEPHEIAEAKKNLKKL